MVYITGDTHGDLSLFKNPKLKKLNDDDILIICGDFGFLWDGSDKEKRLLKPFQRKNTPSALLTVHMKILICSTLTDRTGLKAERHTKSVLTSST